MGKYSDTLVEHVMAPRNAGVMERPDLTGHAGSPGRGAFMIVFLRVNDGRISAAKYHTVGCGPTIASGSMLTELIVGRTMADCGGVTAEVLAAALDGVPPASCAVRHSRSRPCELRSRSVRADDANVGQDPA